MSNLFTDRPRTRFVPGPKAAELLLKTAKKLYTDRLKRWKNDPDMLDMTEGDNTDYILLATLIAAGDAPLALEYADMMDTAARDEIPELTWYHMCVMANDPRQEYCF